MSQIERMIQMKIKDLCLQKELDGKRLFVFGYNGYTQWINNFLCKENYRLNGIIDNDEKKHGKTVYGIPILAPESINWEESETVVLIASKYQDSMKYQIQHLSQSVEIVVLVDILRCIARETKKKKFWLEENYNAEIREIYQGATVYKKLKLNKSIIVFLEALGDIFAGGLYLHAYEKKKETSDIKIIIPSNSINKVAQLFGIKNVIIISAQEMDALVKYLLHFEMGNPNIIVCSCISTLDAMARYKNLSFPVFWAKFFFRLDDYQVEFPSIQDKKLEEEELIKKGLIKNRSIILAPYANTIPELPYQFWEVLVKRLLEMKYRVFTNIAGDQKPIKGSAGLIIPFHQISNYLEFAGYFVALRSGLCDIAGRSQCKQVIIFRDAKIGWHSTQIEFFDLHSENISEDAIQYVYDDCEFTKNVDRIIELLLNQ